MKTVNYLIVVAAFAFSAVSCVESSGKYKSLLAQRDSLQVYSQTLETNNNEILDMLNEVELAFQEIRTTEGKVMMNMNGSDVQSKSRKQQLSDDVRQVKELIATSRTRIQELEEKLEKSGKNSAALRKSIERMKKELEEKSSLILALQDELSKKNIRIQELDTQVGELNTNVAELTTLTTQQDATIKEQDKDINEVWYCVASDKDLKQAKILTGTGLFQSKKVLQKDFDRSIFVEADLRNIKSIPLEVKKAKVLSNHPEGSFELKKGDDKKITLEILDPEKFWSISKYLVVNI